MDDGAPAPLFGSGASPFGRRQRRVRGARIPVTVVTGFLGSGKTTLVRALLRTPEGADTAVVINEYGEVGIDDALVRDSSDTTVLLGNGCVCCTVRSDLDESLRTLFADRVRGAVPSFERVIIETSGLADPGPVVQTFGSDRALGREFHLQSLVAVVDAPLGVANLARAPEARRQIALADRIVLTKTDLVDAAAAAELTERLRELTAAPIATRWTVWSRRLSSSARRWTSPASILPSQNTTTSMNTAMGSAASRCSSRSRWPGPYSSRRWRC